MTTLLLIGPPHFKACEPPASLAFLSGALRAGGVECVTADLNLEGQLHLLQQANTLPLEGKWQQRAVKNCNRNLKALRMPRSRQLYGNNDRYRRCVIDINKVLEMAAAETGAKASLADFQLPGRSPLASEDLLQAAREPQSNPWFSFFSHRLRELLCENGADWLGLSLNFLSEALTTFAIIGWMRQEFPGVKLVVGGGLVTTWMSHPNWSSRESHLATLAHFIAGPGEEALTTLLGGTPVADAPPDYRELAGPYFSPGFVLPWTASRGCFWRRCTFCPETAERNTFLLSPPRKNILQLEKQCERHSPALIHFLDNAITPAMMRELTKWRMPPWYGFARFDGLLTNEKFCRKLAASGCVMLKLGLESGDPAVLAAMNKGTVLPLVERALASLKNAGIATYIYLLFGTPAEERDAALCTRDFVAAHAQEIDFLNLAIFNMPRLSEEARGGITTMDFSDDDLSIYTDFVHPLDWHRGKIRRFLDSDFRRTPEIAAILRRDPPFFTSNHAAFLLPATIEYAERQR